MYYGAGASKLYSDIRAGCGMNNIKHKTRTNVNPIKNLWTVCKIQVCAREHAPKKSGPNVQPEICHRLGDDYQTLLIKVKLTLCYSLQISMLTLWKHPALTHSSSSVRHVSSISFSSYSPQEPLVDKETSRSIDPLHPSG